MSATPLALHEATILQHCKVLHLPIVGGQCGALAAQAVRERHTHLGYLDALLAAEVDERERHTIARRLKDAHLPRVKTSTSSTSARPRRSRRPRSASSPTAATLRAPSLSC